MNSSTTIGSALPRMVSPLQRRGVALALAGVTLAGLLFAFVQVLLGAVAQGDLRRRDDAAAADATWRCKALGSATARATCLTRIAAGHGSR